MAFRVLRNRVRRRQASAETKARIRIFPRHKQRRRKLPAFRHPYKHQNQARGIHTQPLVHQSPQTQPIVHQPWVHTDHTPSRLRICLTHSQCHAHRNIPSQLYTNHGCIRIPAALRNHNHSLSHGCITHKPSQKRSHKRNHETHAGRGLASLPVDTHTLDGVIRAAITQCQGKGGTWKRTIGNAAQKQKRRRRPYEWTA